MSTDTSDVGRLEGKLDALAEGLTTVLVELGSLRTGLDAHIQQQAERTRRRDQQAGDHETRIRKLESHGTDKHEERLDALERLRWVFTGAAAVAGTGAGAVITSVLQAAKG